MTNPICTLTGCGREMLVGHSLLMSNPPQNFYQCPAGAPNSREHQLAAKVVELRAWKAGQEKLIPSLPSTFTGTIPTGSPTFTGTTTPPLYDQLVQAQARIAELKAVLWRVKWCNITIDEPALCPVCQTIVTDALAHTREVKEEK